MIWVEGQSSMVTPPRDEFPVGAITRACELHGIRVSSGALFGDRTFTSASFVGDVGA